MRLASLFTEMAMEEGQANELLSFPQNNHTIVFLVWR